MKKQKCITIKEKQIFGGIEPSLKRRSLGLTLFPQFHALPNW